MPTKSDTPNTDRPDAVFINVAIPADVHRRLRIRQINDGLPMRDVVTAALEAWLNEKH